MEGRVDELDETASSISTQNEARTTQNHHERKLNIILTWDYSGQSERPAEGVRIDPASETELK